MVVQHCVMFNAMSNFMHKWDEIPAASVLVVLADPVNSEVSSP